MAVCNNCGAREVPADEIYLTNASGRWNTRCRNCPGAVDDTMPRPGVLDWMKEPLKKTPSEVVRAFNSIRVCNGLNPFHVTEDNRREYERHTVELSGFYTRRNGTKHYDVGILDLSKGGLRFITDIRLKKNEILQIKIASPENNGNETDEVNFKFNSAVEVVRISAIKNKYEIGARFINNSPSNKRAAPRHQLLLSVWYQRKGQTEANEGAVLDISRTGVGMVVSKKIAKGEILAVCIRGDSGVFAKQELRGLVRVVHSSCLYAGNYELGTEFIKSKVTPRSKSKTGDQKGSTD